MRRFRIGSAFGIPVKLDVTFLLVLPLFAWVIATQVDQWVDLLNRLFGAGLTTAPFRDAAVRGALGFAGAVGLFAGVVLHELGHSLVAMRYGYPIDSITLWLFGGIANLSEMPEDWRHELVIALAGPLVSVALGVVSYAAFLVVPGTGSLALAAATFLCGYLALMNLGLAVFNMLPAFPMDGGRVLRALFGTVWSYARATELAAEVGKGFAVLMGIGGLFAGNLFLVGLAFFVFIAAASEAKATTMRAAFEGVEVRHVMTPADQVSTVDADASVADLIDRMFRERHTGYPVERDGEVVGLVTLDDAQAVREIERDAYRVEEVMSTDLYTVSPATDVMDALDQLNGQGVGRLLVMDDDEELVGLITRSDIMTALSIIKSSGRYGEGPTDTDAEPAVVTPEDAPPRQD